ncbi:AAA family ATPase [bacterium]|nr:AAA family ATPase [bacterium]
MPRGVLKENRLIALFDELPQADQYKILKTQVLQRTKIRGLNTLMITSPSANEGKSLTAANLAICLAKELQNTVLLADLDLRTPSLHSLFGLSPVRGISDFFMRDTPLSELLISPGIHKLTILPGHERVYNSSEVMGSPKMKNLIEEMKQRYQDRYIIFDSPPLLDYADSLILSDYVDGIILVTEYAKTLFDKLEKAAQLLQGKNLIGTVLNKAAI